MPGARLCPREREEISRGVAEDKSFAAIARGLGRPTSTVSREVKRNGGRERYRCWRAESDTAARRRRRRLRKLLANRQLAEAVQAGLEQRWSPEQISCRLRAEHPDDPRWWVSHETIYRSLYVQGGGGLRRELTSALRTGRARRIAHGEIRQGTGPNIVGMVNISERPAEADDRAVPGHWEGDLIIGARHKSQVGTLVERTTRFVMLIHLPGPKDAATLAAGITKKIMDLPDHLRRSLAWDQGNEMARHARITMDSGMKVYFCDPRSPWQRGTNENTNGLLRQYMPKSTDLSVLNAEDLDRIAAELNGRPRKTLGWMTPSEKLAELVAMDP